METPTKPGFPAKDRVRDHTAAHVVARLDRLAEAEVRARAEGGRDAIVARLAELDREWNVDRALMANFALLGGLSFELGRRVHRAFTGLFRAQLAFLLLHAVAGWCPPLPVLRRLGFRTAKEIASERSALLAELAKAPGPPAIEPQPS